MAADLRKTDLSVIGDMPWGTHFCLFYETKVDLLDILIPYFKAGLENHEFCLCVASEPVIAQEAERALREAVPDFERYLAEGQVEIISHMEWYLKEGRFDPLQVRKGWMDKLDQALGQGYAGMRFAANIFWLEKQDWNHFAEYEGKLDEVFRQSRIVGLCAYALECCSAADVLDVVHHHQFTVIRQSGTWEHLEGSELKRAHDEIRQLNADLEHRVVERTAQLATANEQLRREISERKRAEEAIRKSERVLREAESLGHTGSWEHDLVTGEIFNTEENLRLFFGDDPSKGTPFEDYAHAVHPDDREFVMRRRALLLEGGPRDIEYRVVWPDGSVHVLFGRATVVRGELGQPIRIYGTNVDITERKQAEEEIRRYAAQMEALAEISRTFAEAGLDYQDVLRTVARRTAELIGDSCVITLFSDDEQRSFPVAFHHPDPKALALMQDSLLLSWQGGTDTERFGTLLSGESIYIPVVNPEEYRASSEPEFWPYIDNIGISSVLIVPLQVQGRVIGTLGITRDQPGRPYTRDVQLLLQGVAVRAALAIENARLFEAVSEHRQQLRVLGARLAETQESERRQLALELHDEFGQSLSALKMDLAWLHDHLPPRSKSLREKVDSALDLTNETIQMTQRLASQLRPRMLDDLGLAAALEWHVDEWSKRTHIKTKVTLPEEEWELDPSLNTALYRVCQEALTNVVRHAGASKVEVSLAREGDEVVLTVRDTGRGMDAGKITAPESLGLLGMKERVEQIGGRLEVQSEAGKGTTVMARVPVSQSSSPQASHPSPKERRQAGKISKGKGSHKRKS